jgi:hypothetical protein
MGKDIRKAENNQVMNRANYMLKLPHIPSRQYQTEANLTYFFP